jgi:hypothetical protein
MRPVHALEMEYGGVSGRWRSRAAPALVWACGALPRDPLEAGRSFRNPTEYPPIKRVNHIQYGYLNQWGVARR